MLSGDDVTQKAMLSRCPDEGQVVDVQTTLLMKPILTRAQLPRQLSTAVAKEDHIIHVPDVDGDLPNTLREVIEPI